MNANREQKILIAGLMCALVAIPLQTLTPKEIRERNADEAVAVANAIEAIEGTPNAFANYPPMLFKTDEHGVLYAQYSNGWQKVRP